MDCSGKSILVLSKPELIYYSSHNVVRDQNEKLSVIIVVSKIKNKDLKTTGKTNAHNVLKLIIY